MSDYHEDFDRLMEGVRNGSEDAAEELVARFDDDLRRAIRRVLNPVLRSKFDSIDFAQSVWRSFFCGCHAERRFDSAAQLKAFLMRMGRNKVAPRAASG